MPKLSFSKTYEDSSKRQFKPLFVRYLPLEHWRDLQEIMEREKLDVSGAVKFAIKKANGKA